MMLLKVIQNILVILVLVGCATMYHPVGITGGYNETRLDENVFTVTFRGNGYTSTQRAENFALLRAAECSLENGYKYFVIFKSNTQISNSTFTTPTRSTTTQNDTRVISGSIISKNPSNVIEGSVIKRNPSYTTVTTGGQTFTTKKPVVTLAFICFAEKPETDQMVFSAEFLQNSLKEKYRIE